MMEIGVVILFGGLVTPINFLSADGKCLSTYKYQKLAKIITNFGHCPNGKFKLPNLSGASFGYYIVKVK